MMVHIGKRKVSTSNRSRYENEVAGYDLVEKANPDIMILNMEQTMGVSYRKNTETSADMTKNEAEETKPRDGNVINGGDNGENAIKMELHNHNLGEKDQQSEKVPEDYEDNLEVSGHNFIKEDRDNEKTPEDDADTEEEFPAADDEDNQEPMEDEDEDSQEDSMDKDSQEDSMDEDDEESEEYSMDEDDEEISDEDNEENDAFYDREDGEEDATAEDDEANGEIAQEAKEISERDSGKEEQCNEENMETLRKKKIRESMERRRKPVRENSICYEEDGERVRMEKQGDDNGPKEEKKIAEGERLTAGEHIAEKLEASSKGKVKKSRGRNRKKAEDGRSRKPASRAEDKPESSRKKKSKKRQESRGMIFMCSSRTKNDCYHYRVLGLPASKRDMVQNIYKGMRLFLYDIDLKLMYGIYIAAGPGGYNIEPKAFKSQFPSQVRFTVFENCLPLAEEKFKSVIKENYFTRSKFDCQLTLSQVKKLCKLFTPARKVNPSKKMGRRQKAEDPTPVRWERKRRRRGGEKTPMNQERNIKQREDAYRHSALRDERLHHERSRKRRRDTITSSGAIRRQLPPLPAPALTPPPEPQPITVPSYAYRRTQETNAYRLDPYLDNRDPHRGGQDQYFDRRYSYRDGLDPYMEHRDSSRDGRCLAPRESFRREPIPVHPDVYRQDRLVEYNDSYRRDELLGYRGLRSAELETRRQEDIGSHHHYISHRDRPLDLGTRRRDEIISRDRYVSYQDRPLYTDRLYSADHHSQSSLIHEYRPTGTISDLSPRGRLSDYCSHRALSRY